MSDFIFIYITCATQGEAREIGTKLVEEKLAACVNVFPSMTSIYKWEDRLEETEEAVMIVKTWRQHFKAIEAKVKEMHSYETPCICAIPVEAGNPEFLEWI